MWGLLNTDKGKSVSHRFIPTYVGFTGGRLAGVARVAGSSPPMWGLQSYPSSLRRSRPVHPHPCGVYAPAHTRRRRLLAVHPHPCGVYGMTNGKRENRERFIPTHVGFTSALNATSPAGTVHPHPCGVYRIIPPVNSAIGGSSPPMWGLH